nr:immunoglobulin light chain junction region [Macaca mulatta]
CQQHNTYPISF